MSAPRKIPDEAAWNHLERQFQGELLRAPEAARLAVGKQLAAGQPLPQPQAVARCASAADVQRALAWLDETGLNFAVRSGGHCFGDRSSSSGLVLDLSPLDCIRLDGEFVEVGPGALGGDLGLALAVHGRSVPSGGCPLVAVGGFALVGGFGLQGRSQGLLADRVERIDLIDASGQLRAVDADSDPDLLWGLCGAGALGFGVVTGLRLRTHKLPRLRVIFGQWSINRAAELIERWQAHALHADSALTLELGLQAPDLPEEAATVEAFGAIQCVGDTLQSLARVESDLRRALGPLAASLQVFDLEGEAAARYLSGLLDRCGDEAWMPSRPYREHGYQFTRSAFHCHALTARSVDDLVRHLVEHRHYAEFRELELVPWGGAYARANPYSCAGPRDARMLLRHTAVVGARSLVADQERALAWVERSQASVGREPRRPYAGYVEADHPQWAAACYPAALPRLRALKQRIDPLRRFDASGLGF